MKTTSFTRLALAACAGLALQGSWAQGGSADARTQYQRDRAACMAGQTSEGLATCLREAGAALVESRRGGLTDPSPSQARQDALDRCNAFKTDQDRRECVARMTSGQVSGSVEGGGILREKTFTVPGDASGSSPTGPMDSGSGSMPSSGSEPMPGSVGSTNRSGTMRGGITQ
jgi:hypothetical protein